MAHTRNAIAPAGLQLPAATLHSSLPHGGTRSKLRAARLLPRTHFTPQTPHLLRRTPHASRAHCTRISVYGTLRAVKRARIPMPILLVLTRMVKTSSTSLGHSISLAGFSRHASGNHTCMHTIRAHAHAPHHPTTCCMVPHAFTLPAARLCLPTTPRHRCTGCEPPGRLRPLGCPGGTPHLLPACLPPHASLLPPLACRLPGRAA